MARRATHNLHVPLSDDTYKLLREESQQTERSATSLAREAIHQWLEDKRRERLGDEIAAYARKVAGTEHDLDEALETAAIEHLRGSRGRRRR